MIYTEKLSRYSWLSIIMGRSSLPPGDGYRLQASAVIKTAVKHFLKNASPQQMEGID